MVTPVAADPIATEMAEMPRVVDDTLLLSRRQVVIDDQGDYPEVDSNGVDPQCVLPFVIADDDLVVFSIFEQAAWIRMKHAVSYTAIWRE